MKNAGRSASGSTPVRSQAATVGLDVASSDSVEDSDDHWGAKASPTVHNAISSGGGGEVEKRANGNGGSNGASNQRGGSGRSSDSRKGGQPRWKGRASPRRRAGGKERDKRDFDDPDGAGSEQRSVRKLSGRQVC